MDEGTSGKMRKISDEWMIEQNELSNEKNQEKTNDAKPKKQSKEWE